MSNQDALSVQDMRARRCVLYADAAGIFERMAKAEDATVTALMAAWEIFRTEIARHHGTIMELSGDSVVALFVNPVDALESAVSLQEALADISVPGTQGPLLFRIGLTTGEICILGGLLHGHVVNLAARVQTLATKGGIALCPDTWALLVDHPACRDAVPAAVQINPSEPRIRGYQLVSGRGVRDHGLRRPLIGNGISRAAPSILVIPFSGQAAMAGVTVAEIATMTIIHQLSLAQCQVDVGDPTGAISLSQDMPWLAATALHDYVIRGAVAELPEPRLHILLLEAQSGRAIYSETLRLSPATLEETLERTTIFMRNRLVAHEIHQFHRMKFKAKGAYHYLLLAEKCLKNISEAGVRDAIRHLKTALEFDPHYARAYATLSKAYCIAWRFDWDIGVGDSLEEALRMAARAMDMDSQDPAAEAALGFSTFWSKNTAAALASYERAMQLNPTDPELCADAGMVHSYMGNYGRAATLIKHSLKIDSSHPDYRLWSLADVYHGMKNYREAFGVLQRMHDRTQANRLLAACAVRLGQDAAPYVASVLRDQPHFSVQRWMAIQPLENSDEAADYADALIAAGLPH